MKTTNLKEIEEQGYTIVDNLVETAFLDAIKESVTAIFDKQIEYTKSKDIIDLFNEEESKGNDDVFIGLVTDSLISIKEQALTGRLQ